MSNSTIRIIYYVSTGLLTLLMLFSASMYLFNTEMVKEAFSALNYPTYLVYPLAIAKLLGLVAIWTRRSSTLYEWAYAGFFFDTLLAATAHLMMQDGGQGAAIAGIVLVLVSYWASKRV